MSAHDKITRSLRRHNKRNHSAQGGTSHMGGIAWKLAASSPKMKAKDDIVEPMKMAIGERNKS